MNAPYYSSVQTRLLHYDFIHLNSVIYPRIETTWIWISRHFNIFRMVGWCTILRSKALGIGMLTSGVVWDEGMRSWRNFTIKSGCDSQKIKRIFTYIYIHMNSTKVWMLEPLKQIRFWNECLTYWMIPDHDVSSWFILYIMVNGWNFPKHQISSVSNSGIKQKGSRATLELFEPCSSLDHMIQWTQKCQTWARWQVQSATTVTWLLWENVQL